MLAHDCDRSRRGYEQELVARVRAGDRSAFDLMLEPYYERLIQFAASHVKSIDAAEDVVHDVLLKVWTARETFKVQTTLHSYLYAAVRNRALNASRHSRVTRSAADKLLSLVDLLGITRATVLPEAELQALEIDTALQTAQVRQAVDQLPPRQREMFELRVTHGFSFAEVAEVAGVSVRTAETTYLRAVKTLRKQLANVKL